MKPQHLRAILWLRWRISSNQWRRSGALNAIVTTAFVVGAAIASVMLFFAALIGGSLVMLDSKPTPDALMFTWDGIVVLFLFVWLLGLITELQRSEFLSLERLLHLPLSLPSVFFLNYASSLVSLPIIVFVPGMSGLAIACTIANGPAMLTILPLLASFLLMVTALTYHFRGWLATLMANKRRRKTIVVGITVSIILLAQAPQLINLAFWGSRSKRSTKQSQEYTRAVDELTRQLQAGEIDVDENKRRIEQLDHQQKQRRIARRVQSRQSFVDGVVLGNQVVPLGWLPYGVRAAAMGRVLPGLLGSLAMSGIGGLSLWRAYATTMRFYTGSRRVRNRAAKPAGTRKTRKLSNGLETKLPFLSEHAAAIALAGFRSMLRAPEAKMALLTPLVMVGIFGGMTLLGRGQLLGREEFDWTRPFLAIGMVGVLLFGLAHLTINLFGMDRGGFRAYVLMPAERHDVLLGKNLAIVPLAGAIALVSIVMVQIGAGMRTTHLLATLVQLVPSYLLFCVIGNASSILAPMAVASGSLKPAQPKVWPILVQMFFVMLAPISLLPAVAALVAETFLAHILGVRGIPFYLLFSLVEAGFVIWLYRAVIGLQGQWLHKRESRILEILGQVPE